MATRTFKEWSVECSLCGHRAKVFGWSHELPFQCQGTCGSNNYMPVSSGPSQTLMIAVDGIPGGIEIRHGLCNEDGSPRRYDSKTEIYREANRRGYTISGDTPKPYPVAWDGKRANANTQD